MTSEVYTPCPQCREEIPFYHTVDELKECPECGTHWETLFEIADGADAETDAATQAVTDGGVVDE